MALGGMVTIEALPMFHFHWTGSLGLREELGTRLGRKLFLIMVSVPVKVVIPV